MKIAIHKRKGSFSDIWIPYCKENNIPYKIVNCYHNDIVSQLVGCEGLIWHWDLNEYQSQLMSRQLILSLENKGIKVFPNTNTSWHYDDKVGQKYLLEAINAPFINTYVFYTKEDAYTWLENTSFPKVFKLRSGAGSSNVKLVENKRNAKKLINKAFKNGFSKISRFGRLKERVYMLRRDKNLTSLIKLFTGLVRLFVSNDLEKFSHREKGYVYFQDFVPDNEHDIRIVVVGNKCFGMIRYVRDGDFRASGSGLKDYDPNLVNTDCVAIAFETMQKLKSQCTAFDFIHTKDGYKIIEISYAFVTETFPGYWDQNLTWHKGDISPQQIMISDFINSI